jgi:hypothetical protein
MHQHAHIAKFLWRQNSESENLDGRLPYPPEPVPLFVFEIYCWSLSKRVCLPLVPSTASHMATGSSSRFMWTVDIGTAVDRQLVPPIQVFSCGLWHIIVIMWMAHTPSSPPVRWLITGCGKIILPLVLCFSSAYVQGISSAIFVRGCSFTLDFFLGAAWQCRWPMGAYLLFERGVW